MITLEELKAFIASKHKPELAEKDGMVYQIWEDGEITLQKAGPLLWCGTLHCIVNGTCIHVPLEIMPIIDSGGRHGYAFIESKEVGMEIRRR